MKIPCDRRSENTLFPKSSNWARFIDEKTARRLVKKFGSPLLVGRKSLVREQFQRVQDQLQGVEIHYAVKANCDRNVLSVLNNLGAGFDVASMGEIDRIVGLCGSLSKAVFSNPCKTSEAIDKAYAYDCRRFVLDCQSELEKLRHLPEDAKLLLRVGVPAGSCRVNLSQRFGASIEQVHQLGLDAKLHQQSIAGIAFHVGSQATDFTDFEKGFEIADVAWRILKQLGHRLEFINFGGGFPVDYQSFREVDTAETLGQTDSEPISLAAVSNLATSRISHGEAGDYGFGNQGFPLDIGQYLSNVMKLRDQFFGHRNNENQGVLPVKWMCEPGRILVADSVTLLASVIGVKHLPSGKPCYTIDDGLYGSFSGRYFPPDHFRFFSVSQNGSISYDCGLFPSMICGPSCDGGDVLGHSQPLPSLQVGSLVQVPQMGAYTSVGASRFNGLPITRRVWIE